MSVDVHEPAFDNAVVKRQERVIQTQEMRDDGIENLGGHFVYRHLNAEFATVTVAEELSDASSGEEATESTGVMVKTSAVALTCAVGLRSCVERRATYAARTESSQSAACEEWESDGPWLSWMY